MLKAFRSVFSTWNTTKTVSLSETIKQTLKTEANHLGFVLFGCSCPNVAADFERFENWLEQGFGDGMPYLARQQARLARQDPGLLLPDLQTIISLAIPYPLLYPDASTPDIPAHGRLASYACFEDYHERLSDMASNLAGKLIEMVPESENLICVDTAPILEKAYAHQAGLGWIGQNTLLFNAEYGSRLLLAEILTTLKLPEDEPLSGDLCAGCGLCLQACPTGALLGGRDMDSRRCLSYLSIENRKDIPVQFRHALDNRVFGCDACQLACPYNNVALPLQQEPHLSVILSPSVDLQTELKLDVQAFHARYAGTSILRAKHTGFLRNSIIAAANSGDITLLPQLRAMLNKNQNPILQDALAWAISKLESTMT
jgi:epoxyqueuosine reductase